MNDQSKMPVEGTLVEKFGAEAPVFSAADALTKKRPFWALFKHYRLKLLLL